MIEAIVSDPLPEGLVDPSWQALPEIPSQWLELPEIEPGWLELPELDQDWLQAINQDAPSPQTPGLEHDLEMEH